MADFSSNLKRLRKKADMSQDALAEKLCVSRQTVSSWERGKSYPDLDMLVQISETLRTTPNELLYPPVGKRQNRTDELLNRGFQKLAAAVFVCGFLMGVSSGSQAYAPTPDAAGWHFVFSDALRYWIPAFLSGMAFMGIQKILSLLYEIRDCE